MDRPVEPPGEHLLAAHSPHLGRSRPPLKVLLGDDGSPGSLAAQAFLRSLPFAAGSAITLLSLLEPQDRLNPDSTPAYALGEFAPQVSVQRLTLVRKGHPALLLTDFARHSTPDLIVAGAHSRGELTDGRNSHSLSLGSVAQQLVEYAPLPVLIVRPAALPLKTVMLAIDGSIHCLFALEFLAHFPLPESVRLLLVNVAAAEDDCDMHDEVIEGRRLLAQSAQRLAAAGLTPESFLAHGPAAPALLDFARRSAADLVVLAARGISSSPGWLLGSVAHQLVYSLGCSVLLVKDI